MFLAAPKIEGTPFVYDVAYAKIQNLRDYIYCEQREYGWIVREGEYALDRKSKPFWAPQLNAFLEQLPAIMDLHKVVGSDATILVMPGTPGCYVLKTFLENLR